MRRFVTSGLVFAIALAASAAHAFPHVVQKGETLAQIAERSYGLVEMERVLVAANGLDAQGGIAIVPGMRLEVPAIAHRRCEPGDTWAALARDLLGDESRADVLSMANDGSPWLPPSDGQEIIVPYNLRVVVGQADTIITIAQRFLGVKEKAWVLAHYNHLGEAQVHRGDLVLVPLANLKLTEDGKKEAARAEAFERTEATGGTREAQHRVDAEMPALLADVRSGRYVEAVDLASRLLGYGDLTKPQLALLERQLLEAYVALDASGLATAACLAWRREDPLAVLDPTYVSPKIIAACDARSR